MSKQVHQHRTKTETKEGKRKASSIKEEQERKERRYMSSHKGKKGMESKCSFLE